MDKTYLYICGKRGFCRQDDGQRSIYIPPDIYGAREDLWFGFETFLLFEDYVTDPLESIDLVTKTLTRALEIISPADPCLNPGQNQLERRR